MHISIVACCSGRLHTKAQSLSYLVWTARLIVCYYVATGVA